MKTLSMKDVARKANMTVGGVRWNIRNGLLKTIPIPANKGSKQWYVFRPPDVDEWLRRRREEEAARKAKTATRAERRRDARGEYFEARVEAIVRRVLREAGFLVLE